jgi:hypothetical protein
MRLWTAGWEENLRADTARIQIILDRRISSAVPGEKILRRTCVTAIRDYFPSDNLEMPCMKTEKPKAIEQPATFTPGITKAMVRQHAYELFRDKLPAHPLTLQDWVLAEKDLVNSLEADQAKS